MSLKHLAKKRFRSRLPQFVEILPLFYANRQTLSGKPNGWVRSTDAVLLIDQGLANWTTADRKSVTIKYKETAIPRPDRGCTMGPLVSEGVVDGLPLFVALIAEWAPKTASSAVAASAKPVKAMSGGRRNKTRAVHYPFVEAEAA